MEDKNKLYTELMGSKGTGTIRRRKSDEIMKLLEDKDIKSQSTNNSEANSPTGSTKDFTQMLSDKTSSKSDSSRQ